MHVQDPFEEEEKKENWHGRGRAEKLKALQKVLADLQSIIQWQQESFWQLTGLTSILRSKSTISSSAWPTGSGAKTCLAIFGPKWTISGNHLQKSFIGVVMIKMSKNYNCTMHMSCLLRLSSIASAYNCIPLGPLRWILLVFISFPKSSSFPEGPRGKVLKEFGWERTSKRLEYLSLCQFHMVMHLSTTELVRECLPPLNVSSHQKYFPKLPM